MLVKRRCDGVVIAACAQLRDGGVAPSSAPPIDGSKQRARVHLGRNGGLKMVTIDRYLVTIRPDKRQGTCVVLIWSLLDQ